MVLKTTSLSPPWVGKNWKIKFSLQILIFYTIIQFDFIGPFFILHFLILWHISLAFSLINSWFFRSKTQRVDFSTSISFIDVTSPSTTQFAEYPVLEAKFPHDFFYPFVSSTSPVASHTCHSYLYLLLSYILIFVAGN